MHTTTSVLFPKPKHVLTEQKIFLSLGDSLSTAATSSVPRSYSKPQAVLPLDNSHKENAVLYLPYKNSCTMRGAPTYRRDDEHWCLLALRSIDSSSLRITDYQNAIVI